MKKLFYLGWWFLRARLFGRKAPLQTVLFISDICNLRCKHCSVYELKNPHNMTYEQVRQHLQMSYDAGSRFVDFEGGEVTIWKDGDKRINDLIDLAKEIGFEGIEFTDLVPEEGFSEEEYAILQGKIDDKLKEIEKEKIELESQNEIDFDDMIKKATNLVKNEE